MHTETDHSVGVWRKYTISVLKGNLKESNICFYLFGNSGTWILGNLEDLHTVT